MGCLTCVTGVSGSGKSSILLAIAGLLAAAGLIIAAPAFAETYSLKVMGQPAATGLIQKNVEQPFFENFKEKTGITVHVVAVGTGQAIKNAQNGDGDVLLVHARPAEEKFVADGYGVERFDVMYNDFVIVGPADDPAGVAGMSDVVAALEKIATWILERT